MRTWQEEDSVRYCRPFHAEGHRAIFDNKTVSGGDKTTSNHERIMLGEGLMTGGEECHDCAQKRSLLD